MRPKKWNALKYIGFNTESYLLDALKQDMEEDGFSDFTFYFNVILIKILGEDNDAVKQFRREHPEYKRS